MSHKNQLIEKVKFILEQVGIWLISLRKFSIYMSICKAFDF